jgi:hypothetical protein
MIFYVINQIANTLVTFSVSYLRNGSLAFKALAEMDLLVRMNGTRVDRDVKTFTPSSFGTDLCFLRVRSSCHSYQITDVNSTAG